VCERTGLRHRGWPPTIRLAGVTERWKNRCGRGWRDGYAHTTYIPWPEKAQRRPKGTSLKRPSWPPKAVRSIDRQPARFNRFLAFSRADLTFLPIPCLLPENIPPLLTSRTSRLVDQTQICFSHFWSTHHQSFSSARRRRILCYSFETRPYMYANRRAIQPLRPPSPLSCHSGDHSAT